MLDFPFLRIFGRGLDSDAVRHRTRGRQSVLSPDDEGRTDSHLALAVYWKSVRRGGHTRRRDCSLMVRLLGHGDGRRQRGELCGLDGRRGFLRVDRGCNCSRLDLSRIRSCWGSAWSLLPAFGGTGRRNHWLLALLGDWMT
jgi:hypothetical protein